MNIVNYAMLGVFILAMPERPNVGRLTDYYCKWKLARKKLEEQEQKYSAKLDKALAEYAELKAQVADI